MDAKTVNEFFALGEYAQCDKAQMIADLCNGDFIIDPYNIEDDFPGTQKWVDQSYNIPNQHELVMSALNDLLGGFGVEAIRDPTDSDTIIATYINQGDTYDATIVFDEDKSEFVLTTWGDWFENWENDQNEEDGTLTCGWCSYRTPYDPEEEDEEGNTLDWHDVICESCGNYVDGKPGPNN